MKLKVKTYDVFNRHTGNVDTHVRITDSTGATLFKMSELMSTEKALAKAKYLKKLLKSAPEFPTE